MGMLGVLGSVKGPGGVKLEVECAIPMGWAVEWGAWGCPWNGSLDGRMGEHERGFFSESRSGSGGASGGIFSKNGCGSVEVFWAAIIDG